MFDVDDIAAQADVIIGGFAALIRDESVKVVNLNTGIGAAVFTPDGTLVKTNMDDIELSIARDVQIESLHSRKDDRYLQGGRRDQRRLRVLLKLG